MIRVIGLGSPFGQDRAGWLVIERLQGRAPADVELLALDRPGAGLIGWFRGVEHLVIVDAVLGAGAAQAFVEIAPKAIRRAQPLSMSGHGLRLDRDIALARVLGLLPQRLEIYGVTIADDRQITEDAVIAGASALANHLIPRLTCRDPVPDRSNSE